MLAESAAQSVRFACLCFPFEWNSPLAAADLLLYREASSCALLQRFLNHQSWGPCCVSAPVAAVIAGIDRFLFGDVSPGESWLQRLIGRGFNMFQMSSLDAYICTGHVFFCFCAWGVEALFHDPNVKLVVRPPLANMLAHASRRSMSVNNHRLR